VPELAKAELRELDADFENEVNNSAWVTVQFNPETLKVSFANQLVQPSGAGDQRGPAARQFVGAGTTKLALQLWFDASAPKPVANRNDNDVRKLTQKVAYYITPKAGQSANQFVPPGVRFIWGSFQFDGMMDSLEESLEFFSPDGRPLRASVSIALSQQKITAFTFRPTTPPAANPPGAGGPGAGAGAPAAPAGTAPLTQAPAGSTFQGLADQAGRGGDWQVAASLNGVENPRLLQAGAVFDLNLGAGASLGASASVGIGG
jgi:hypothetical protein